MDLFEWAWKGRSYPESPGFKEATTSRVAAEKIAPRAPTLRDKVMTCLNDVWPAGMTADEVAEALGETVLAVRPRLSELKAKGMIGPSEATRPNASGVHARVMVAKRGSNGA